MNPIYAFVGTGFERLIPRLRLMYCGFIDVCVTHHPRAQSLNELEVVLSKPIIRYIVFRPSSPVSLMHGHLGIRWRWK